jgi:ABC-2 type transport system permease protein
MGTAGPPRPRTIGRIHWIGFATLFRRELRRYTKESLETVVAPAVQTVLYAVVFLAALGPARGTPESDALMRFLMPGLIVMPVLLRAAETTAFTLMFDRMEGIISDILMAPLGAAEMTAAYALAGALSGLATGAVVLAGAALVWPLAPARPLTVLGFAAAGALMLSLVGIIVGLWGRKWDHLAAAYGFCLLPLTMLSGIFAPVTSLPGPVERIVRINPLFYAIDGFRYGFLGESHAEPVLSAGVLAAVITALWALCAALLRRGWRLKA